MPALSPFVSRAIDHYTPFFDVLKGSKKFEWTEKCEQAFLALKEHLGHSPLLSKPIEGEKLYLYLLFLRRQSAPPWSERKTKYNGHSTT